MSRFFHCSFPSRHVSSSGAALDEGASFNGHKTLFCLISSSPPLCSLSACSQDKASYKSYAIPPFSLRVTVACVRSLKDNLKHVVRIAEVSLLNLCNCVTISTSSKLSEPKPRPNNWTGFCKCKNICKQLWNYTRQVIIKCFFLQRQCGYNAGSQCGKGKYVVWRIVYKLLLCLWLMEIIQL